MDSYRETLAAYLSVEGRTQAKLADEISTSQVAVSRYVSGARFPDSSIAREIDRATGGEVPFSAWQAEASQRMGLDIPTSEAA
jgi:transcriptional regulator with XRE-family HTH domain